MFTEHFRESKTDLCLLVMVFMARRDNLRTGTVHRPFVFDIYKVFYYVCFSFFMTLYYFWGSIKP